LHFGAQSEIGKLCSVLMHRPGKEIFAVNHNTLSYYGFRDIPDLKNLQAEYDILINILKREDVEVLLLNELLNNSYSTSNLPNLYFTRDIISITNIGVIVMNMGISGRSDEPNAVKNVIQEKIPIVVEINHPGYLEGGDFVYLDEKTLAIGYGPRTNLDGIDQLIQGLKGSIIEEVIGVPLPPHLIHLDQAFSVIAPQLAVVNEPSLRYDKSYIFNKREIKKESFLNYLKKKGFDKVTVTKDEVMQFGANICVIETGKILIYEWNQRIIMELEQRGIEVISIPGKELVKGGGGPHCMTCPILREKL
jgi:arginine deiminase